ncbi:MAG: DUF1656 domain-containing protein [Sphingomonadaceae bacterium]|nr:DUF1656 domain-containing protein [Sphingomonadaceae bacterium]
MIGEISIGGVYMPSLLLLGVVALLLTGIAARLLNLIGAYRLVFYRPLADVALFVLILGALVWCSAPHGSPA